MLRDGTGAQRIVVLGPDPPRRVIGRRSDCEIALTWDGGVSRAHATLERLGAEWVVADDELSANGTWIDGQRVRAPRVLRDGDVLVVGATSIGFCAATDSQTAVATIRESSAGVEVSPAQRAVLVRLCRPILAGGRLPAGNAEIAAALTIGQETVKSHLKALYQRYGLADVAAAEKRSALAHAAIDAGTVTLRDAGSGPPASG